MPSGLLSTAGINKLAKLRDVNTAAQADQYTLVWDSATSTHVYIAIVAASAADASGFGWVIDEDNLASDLDTKVPTQQSVKAYVDGVIAGLTALEATDIDTLAEINAIIGDATLVTVEATDASGYGWVIDEDDMTSDSATKVPTQQSVKAYVDAAGGVTDHGALSGLGDDDHSQYLLTAGTRAGTGIQEFLGINLTDSTELTIATGAITVTQGYHTVDTESDAATDDLDTITVAGGEGDVLILRAESSARTVVIKHGTGNIQCAEGYDLSLDSDYDYAILIRKDGSNWMAFSGARRMPPYLDNGDTLGGTQAGDTYYHDGTTVTNLRKGSDFSRKELRSGLPTWQPRYDIVSVTDGATVTVDQDLGDDFEVTLAGNRTLALTNPKKGQSVLLKIKQDGTGTRLISTWPTSVKWPGGTAPTLTTTANESDWIGFKCIDATTPVYHGFVVGQGYAA